jgi:adenylate cyclase
MHEYEAVPILFLTAAVNHLEQAFEAGGDDLLEKPVDARILRARLNAHMQRAEHAVFLSSTRRMLDSYVSKRTREMAEQAASTGRMPVPTRGNVVILFTDIRGFTALSEEMDPDELFNFVSAQLAMQVHTVYDFGGYVDKFGGDGLMAVFDDQDMVKQSCLCALRILEKTEQIGSRDVALHRLGIGIHMGPVVMGNLGSPQHLDYSAIGSAVNLAARLCGFAKAMSIIVSKAIRDAAGDDQRLLFDGGQSVSIRGMKDPITVYTLSSADQT